jgi:hypothetical protein
VRESIRTVDARNRAGRPGPGAQRARSGWSGRVLVR